MWVCRAKYGLQEYWKIQVIWSVFAAKKTYQNCIFSVSTLCLMYRDFSCVCDRSYYNTNAVRTSLGVFKNCHCSNWLVGFVEKPTKLYLPCFEHLCRYLKNSKHHRKIDLFIDHQEQAISSRFEESNWFHLSKQDLQRRNTIKKLKMDRIVKKSTKSVRYHPFHALKIALIPVHRSCKPFMEPLGD